MGLYGRTISSADPWARATEDDATILMDWCVHTLQTKPGTLTSAPEHGLDLPGQLLAGLTPATRIALPQMAKAALERGRKVASAKVELVETPLGGGRVAISLRIEVKPATGGPAVSFTHAVDGTLADDIQQGT